MADGSYRKAQQDGEPEFDPEQFLTAVDAQFESEDIVKEVRWRLGVLKEISAQPELEDVSAGLRDRLTRIFSVGGEEREVLQNLKELTEITREDGEAVELRRFVKRGKRTLNEFEYRQILAKKIQNTQLQMENLMAFYPEASQNLTELTKATKKLVGIIKNQKIPVQTVKEAEDKVRQSSPFVAYEEFKGRFLRDWLARFTDLSPDQIEGKSPEDIQQMVIEHQRHQMTHLLKTKITLSDMDMTEHLGLHDTLECTFSNEDFWERANQGAKYGFRQLILTVIQSFGMLKGQRYAFFQSQDDKDQFLLFGVGFANVPVDADAPIEMVPYIKPFTRKGGYILEIRNRELGDPEQYNHELHHYVLPFMFALDQIPNFKVGAEIMEFFTSNY